MSNSARSLPFMGLRSSLPEPRHTKISVWPRKLVSAFGRYFRNAHTFFSLGVEFGGVMSNVKSCSQNPSSGFNGERLRTVAPFRSDTYSYETHVFCSLPQRRGHGRTQRSAGIAAGAASPHTRGGPGLLSRRGGSQHFEVRFASSPPSARRARRSTPRCRNEVRHHLSHPKTQIIISHARQIASATDLQ